MNLLSPHFIRSVVLALMLSDPWAQVTAHPGTLDEYPERFPGKTLQDIVDAWEPRAEGEASSEELVHDLRDLSADWLTKPAIELTMRIDAALERNRRGDYRKRTANALHDMRDLLGSGDAGRSQEAADYIVWRLDHMDADDGFFEDPPTGSWDETKDQAGERTRQWETERNKAVAEISIKADSASVTLRPHWLIQCGALEFRHRRYFQAAGYFQRVRDGFPQHPRTEVAQLMMARVRLDEWRQQWRSYQRDERKTQNLLNETRREFDTYRSQFPRGRFLADVGGWEAGISRELGAMSDAMRSFLSQAKTPDHPEIRHRAFQQIEWLLSDLAMHPAELERLPWNQIAAEPMVALRAGYFMLDAESERDLGALMFRRSGGDHRVLESLAPTLAGVRAAAKHAWSALDQALADQPEVYRGEKAIIRDVLHSWSAIMRGEPMLVHSMVDGKAAGPSEDDALLVRATAWVKAGRHAEAIHAFDELDRRCPESALRRGANMRRVDAWLRLRNATNALPLLWRMLEGDDVAIYKADATERPALNLPGEIEQRLTALLTFAPLTQLDAAARAVEVPAKFKTALRSTLRIRHLSEGRFSESLRYAEDADFLDWYAAHRKWDELPEGQTITWREHVVALQQLSVKAGQAPTADAKASAWLALGKAWEQRLWQLLDGGSIYAGQDIAMASLPSASFEVRHHAPILGITDEEAVAVLDQRLELTHAINCHEQALKFATKGSDAALAAMLALHAALRTRAEFSPYRMNRAVELGDAARSKQLHDRIKVEHPTSDAAKSIVWWSFRPATTLGRWKPGSTALFEREAEVAALMGSGVQNKEDEWRIEQAIKALIAQVKIAFATEQNPSILRDQIALIRRDARRETPAINASTLLNHLDDLDLLLTVQNLSAEARTAYFAARMEGKTLDTNDPALAPIQDFVTFWNYATTPSTVPMTEIETRIATAHPERPARQRAAQAQAARSAQFLAKFPRSPKREAALARLAINTLRQSRCHCGMKPVNAVATATTRYAIFHIERGVPFDAKSVMAALDQYDHEFPHGRYRWDIRLIRGIAAAEQKNWAAAMAHFIAILANAEKRDLHLDASNNLCAICRGAVKTGLRVALKTGK